MSKNGYPKIITPISRQKLNEKNLNKLIYSLLRFHVVRLIGLEPTQPELPDPKSGASTNFATGAGFFAGAKIGFF